MCYMSASILQNKVFHNQGIYQYFLFFIYFKVVNYLNHNAHLRNYVVSDP